MRRKGFTLVELLVVIGLIVLLTAISIPTLRLALKSNRIREAARSVNVYLGRARNTAIETGRPHGVLFERFGRQQEACIVLRQVESPSPYAGDFQDAAVRMQDWTINPNTGKFYHPGGLRVVKVAVRHSDFSDGLIRRGDNMQLGYQGPCYRIIEDLYDSPDRDFPVDDEGFILFSVGEDTEPPQPASPGPDGWIDTHVLTLVLSNIEANVTPWPRVQTVGGDPWPSQSGFLWPNAEVRGIGYPRSPGFRESNAWRWSELVAFQVARQPVSSVAAPLHLGRRAVVDLAASGPDSLLPDSLVSENPGDQLPVVVMFSPNGAVDRVYFDHPTYGYGGHRLAEPVHFLIGRWERMRDAPAGSPGAEDGLLNWQDASNLWVTLNAQTGLVTVAELNADQLDATTNMYVPSSRDTARQFAREAQISKGGR